LVPNRHAWNLIPAALADAHEQHAGSTTSCNIDVHRSVPIIPGVDRGSGAISHRSDIERTSLRMDVRLHALWFSSLLRLTVQDRRAFARNAFPAALNGRLAEDDRRLETRSRVPNPGADVRELGQASELCH